MIIHKNRKKEKEEENVTNIRNNEGLESRMIILFFLI